MKVRLRASTDATVVVWHEKDVLHARRADAADPAQICLAVDLFEVIAELAGLDLEHPEQAAEAIGLAERAQRSLGVGRRPDGGGGAAQTPDEAR